MSDSAFRKGQRESQDVVSTQWLVERLHFILINEDANVRADTILFIDYSEANSGVSALEIGEQLTDRRTSGRHLSGASRVGAQRRGKPDRIRGCSAHAHAQIPWVME